MASTIIPKATRGQSAEMTSTGTAILPGIPFDDELPGDPAGNRGADRTEAYDDAREKSTRQLVKIFRGAINQQGDEGSSIHELCEIGIERAMNSGSADGQALFRTIRRLRIDELRHLWEMHGIVEALIDRLPREGGAA